MQFWISCVLFCKPRLHSHTVSGLLQRKVVSSAALSDTDHTAYTVPLFLHQSVSPPSETPAEEPTEIPEDPAGTGDSGSVLTSEDTLLNTNGQPLTVTVTNSSSEAITVAATSQNGNVTVTPASAVIEADASVDFTVAPAEDLNKETEYIDQVYIQDINNPFICQLQQVHLVSIIVFLQ